VTKVVRISLGCSPKCKPIFRLAADSYAVPDSRESMFQLDSRAEVGENIGHMWVPQVERLVSRSKRVIQFQEGVF